MAWALTRPAGQPDLGVPQTMALRKWSGPQTVHAVLRHGQLREVQEKRHSPSSAFETIQDSYLPTMRGKAIVAAALLAGGFELAAASGASRCNADNCLRAMRATQTPGRLESAKAFCATYTRVTDIAAPTAVPSYAADGCKDNMNGPMAVRISSACSCIAPGPSTTTTPPAPTTTPPPSATRNPCAKVSASWSEQLRTATGKAVPTVAASLALECLKTVPLGKDEAVELIDAIEPYLEWQSDAAYKKDPPPSYFYPGFDLFGNLAAVRSNVQAGKYAGEFDFQTDLYKQVWAPGQDGHYVFYPDLLARAFRWRRAVPPIVSISEDGESLPVIKLQTEVVANPETAQAITMINGIDAAKYVEDTVNAASYLQDVDASYNTMFWSKATAANGGVGNFISGGRSALFYHGDSTSLTFANGTTVEIENKAAVVGDMTGVMDGPSMYKKFCTPLPLKPNMASVSAIANATVPGYPKPVIASSDGVVSGYYLSGAGLDDVAVLYLMSFEPKSPAEFQAVVSDFLREAKAAGKTKLIVDLQNNGGGYILLGYDFFRQLFPSVVQDGNSRWKQSKSFAALARYISDAVQGVNPATEANSDLIEMYETWWNYRYDLDVENKNFATFADKFQPHVRKDTDYTNLMRWNLSDHLTTYNTTYGMGIDISGYGIRSNLSQAFEAEDIVILYDGACSSTCTLASEMLRLQGGVKSIAMGGRPQQGPMQGVGGIKGSQILNFLNIYTYANYIAQLTKDTSAQAELRRFKPLPMQRSTGSAVNVRDQILRDNVEDGIPAQYVTEEADCRLYWTAPMISDVGEVWKSAANAALNGAKCVYGGIAGSKPNRRSPVASVLTARDPVRMSDSVDKTPIAHGLNWEAQHLQVAIN
ncbi:pyridine nucleotide-disulfide oxidoreductase family protein [Metarhizium album ARSEF 1941]|uniref:Pyridine nucleotide-disulfide oxidoreductase family protein n=1 Tax=Metarhizium album (strain ARSEF 1941) TaxID=1081103 RepID=A0A0B2WSS7_METAS|nr:pyridine nucleotide-disulfide oxidoreductase family protein [Metarhizium album ARSEF 1941]KHN96542.1 pyridine nucleotide-disulfide oxidoreductase family protein [Metarhizium album ARSEF 1941]